MTFLEQGLAGRRVFAELPPGVAEWVPALEVAVQEGLRALAFHAGDVALLAEALPLFGRRARLGIWGATTAQAVSDAVGAGAHFVTSPIADAALAAASGGVAFLPGGLTPAELLAAPGDAVQLVPADAMPLAYVRALPTLLGGRRFVASGRAEPYQVGMWFTAGAAAVGVALGDARPGSPGTLGDLGDLRSRCRALVAAIPSA